MWIHVHDFNNKIPSQTKKFFFWANKKNQMPLNSLALREIGYPSQMLGHYRLEMEGISGKQRIWNEVTTQTN